MRIIKGFHGKQIETVIPIDNHSQLTVTTMKRHSGAVSTTVQQEQIEGDFLTYNFGDYAETLACEKIRATEKALIRQHTQALEEYKSSDNYKKLKGE